ncbi:MAG: M48 family metallopeptidase [Candidatus Moraniibacteriota bacterium]
MEKEIIIAERKINYQIRKNSLSKNLRLSVRFCSDKEIGCEADSNVKILVTIPGRLSEKVAENFVRERQAWLLQKIDELKKSRIYPREILTAKDYQKEKRKARKIIIERVNYLGRLYGFEFNKISIRSQRTRWGSCSQEGNLNFNYKLIYLPEKIIDYVIIHELCHLEEFNHSKRFWFLVSEIIPDYRNLRRELKNIKL